MSTVSVCHDNDIVIHTYIHDKSYSAQSYIKQSDCALQKSTHVDCRTNFGLVAFTVAGPTARNSLPDYLRDPSLSENTFRRLLKTYLFALY